LSISFLLTRNYSAFGKDAAHGRNISLFYRLPGRVRARFVRPQIAATHVFSSHRPSEKPMRPDAGPTVGELNRAPRFLFSHYNEIVLFLATM
jgi:hypothetical protein